MPLGNIANDMGKIIEVNHLGRHRLWIKANYANYLGLHFYWPNLFSENLHGRLLANSSLQINLNNKLQSYDNISSFTLDNNFENPQNNSSTIFDWLNKLRIKMSLTQT